MTDKHDGYSMWRDYFAANPTTTILKKDGLVVISAPHECGCKYCRGLVKTETSEHMIETGMSRPSGHKPSCAK